MLGFALLSHLPEAFKTFFIVGFLGSFTTFSAFSGEIVEKILYEKWQHAATILLLHTGGVLATLLGVFLVKAIK